MDNRKQQPFYVGQRVVCVRPGKTGCKTYYVYKDHRYTVSVVDTFQGCAVVELEGMPDAVWKANRFAPYDPPAIEIPAELLEVDVKDGIDVKPVKELI